MNRGKAVVGTGEASRKQGLGTRCQGSRNPPPGLAVLAASVAVSSVKIEGPKGLELKRQRMSRKQRQKSNEWELRPCGDLDLDLDLGGDANDLPSARRTIEA
ncbi:hypothetical protein FVEG_17051 [Fusarium verticillioides 7600]|uniref:Uncharacterized protein n=1 Tax=Gibberella moniliformis (strain M3125 / FGSC 7600) TaxID=334819 RepID=W7MZ33_GIBM7|nr:hypothetical protein FVEG_17051 [Fusarium verticillioides 7600]EWG53054.1 hypothetical protein FVEG_17051 [Fusarium verticillioides 7600]